MTIACLGCPVFPFLVARMEIISNEDVVGLALCDDDDEFGHTQTA